MPKRKRSDGERMKDLQVVGRLDSMGCSQLEIRSALNDDRAARGLKPLSKSQIHYDVKASREIQATRAAQEIRIARGQRMAQLELIFREAYKGYVSSKKVMTNTTEISSPRKADGRIVESQKVKKQVKENPGGDSRLLLVMLKATELQIHLGNLEHPEIDQALKDHPPLLPELNSLEDAHKIMERVMGSRHRRSGQLLLWRGKDRKRV